MAGHPVFPYAGIEFFRDLSRNNTKTWFLENRHYYDHVILPALREILAWVWEQVGGEFPGYIADPRVNKSLYRINRDIRFSKDKSSYKTYNGLLIYRGNRKDSPCLYLHFATDEVFWTNGWYSPSPVAVRAYRRWIADPKVNKKFGDEVARVQKRYPLMRPQLKRMPAEARGLELPHPELFLYKGLVTYDPREPGDWLERQGWLEEAARMFRYCRPFMNLLGEWHSLAQDAD
ncbi:DUF2461 domain-containing protein [bacterium]|nr:DUF2461 domain-containing protein [bacterium]